MTNDEVVQANRTEILQVRLRPTELRYLRAWAEYREMRLTDYVRHLLSDATARMPPRDL